MGAELVGDVLTNHARLPDRSFRVLLRMAHTALDTEQPQGRGRPGSVAPATYWAGWEPLALVLGRLVPDPCTDGGRSCRCQLCRDRSNAAETVRRAVQELVRRGLVTPLASARPGKNAVYGLNLMGHRHGAPSVTPSRQKSPTAKVPHSPTATVPHSNGMPHRHGGGCPTATVPPRKKEEPGGEEPAEDTPTPVPASTPDRARDETIDDEQRPVKVTPLPPRAPADAARRELHAMRAAR